MKQSFKLILSMACIGILVFCSACAKKQVRSDSMAGEDSAQIAAGTDEGIGSGELEESELSSAEFKEISTTEASVFKDINFGYDDFSLRPDAKAILDVIADFLLKNTSTQVLIEGHCDERGTNEYNLALGERRANSAKKYLAQLGVAPKEFPRSATVKKNPWTLPAPKRRGQKTDETIF